MKITIGKYSENPHEADVVAAVVAECDGREVHAIRIIDAGQPVIGVIVKNPPESGRDERQEFLFSDTTFGAVLIACYTLIDMAGVDISGLLENVKKDFVIISAAPRAGENKVQNDG